MGAQTFFIIAKGKDAHEAFVSATSRARYENGHNGYTGTIAEKDSFTLIRVPLGMKALEFAEQLLDGGDERIDDKWGPAGCVRLEDNHYAFFGWASC